MVHMAPERIAIKPVRTAKFPIVVFTELFFPWNDSPRLGWTARFVKSELERLSGR